MSNYTKADKRKKGMIDGVNADRLKRNYTSDDIRVLATAYDRALLVNEAMGTSRESVIRIYLTKQGFDMSKLNSLDYQAWIAYRMSKGEFGGLQKKAEPVKTLDTKIEDAGIETNKPKSIQGAFDFL